MVSRRRFIILASTGALAAGGAAAGFAALPSEAPRSGPPQLRYGEERCAYCGMVIDDARFAAAWREGSGREQHFDDIGCMVNAGRQRDPGSGTERFVHDFHDKSWVAATTATYARSSTVKTPMAYGVIAFSSAEAAAAFVESSGTPLDWAALLRQVERKG